jgi:hypothetical protein
MDTCTNASYVYVSCQGVQSVLLLLRQVWLEAADGAQQLIVALREGGLAHAVAYQIDGTGPV